MILGAANIVADPEKSLPFGGGEDSKHEQTDTWCQAKLRAMNTNSKTRGRGDLGD